MVVPVEPQSFDAAIRFDGGISMVRPEDRVSFNECVEGKNFVVDLRDASLRGRPPFDLLGTAPNASEIRGYAQLEKIDGSITTLIQAGDTVYEWDGGSTFTSVGTVSANSRLRGRSNWSLDERDIITDLELQSAVKSWDGSTFEDMPHNLPGPFLAKRALVSEDRLWFANVISGTAVPHMLVGSALEDFETLSVSDRPSSALSEADPFFLTTPDLRDINGLLEAFGQFVISSKNGRLFQLSGKSAQDFAIEKLYPNSAATGEESIAFIGDDIAYSRYGRIESLRGTLNFGDVETDDLSFRIQPLIKNINDFVTLYDPLEQRVLFWPEIENEIYAYQKGAESPWSIWRTAHSSAFQRTTAMVLTDPSTGRDRIYWGDGSGNVYGMNGTTDDAGSAVAVEWVSPMLVAPWDADMFDIDMIVKYRKKDAPFNMTLSLLFSGTRSTTVSKTISADAPDDANYFGGSAHFGAANYFGSQDAGNIRQQKISFAGKSSQFQVKVEASGDFEITEIQIRAAAAS